MLEERESLGQATFEWGTGVTNTSTLGSLKDNFLNILLHLDFMIKNVSEATDPMKGMFSRY